MSTKSWHFRRRKSTYDGGYVLFIVILCDYTYETLIERHTQHNDKPIEDVMQQLPQWLKEVEVELDEQQLASVEHYLRDKYGDTIPVITGGKFGKVLIHV